MADLIQRTFKRLDQQLDGNLSRPGSERYIAATSIWAKPVDPLPRAVAHCRTAQDVQAAIRAARDCYLPLSVRGGGHDWAGRALCDGIVIDLSQMNRVLAGPDFRSTQVGGGARAADVVAVTDPLRLAAALGSVGAVGVGGLTLGGGYGALIGRCGLALDNLLGAEIVLADGRIVTAAPDKDADLLWALRGGGGNFGVVTNMHHRLHDVPSVHSGMLIYPFSEAKSVLQASLDIIASMPEELSVQFCFVGGPDGLPIVILVPTWCGRPEEGDARTSPFLGLGTLLAGSVSTQSYGASLRLFDGHFVNGHRVFADNCLLPRLDADAVDILIRTMETAVSPGCAIITHEFKGAASRVPVAATAFGLRRDHVLIEIVAIFPGQSDIREAIRHQQWARITRQALMPISLPGGYPNMLASGDVERAAKSYGGNLERLLAIKRQYDPGNVFHSAIPLPIYQHNGRHRQSARSLN